MINKSLLPVQLQLPLLGNVVFLTQGLKYNFELILFWGPCSLFQNKWNLHAKYKRSGNRLELAQQLSRVILVLGLANLLLCPFILVWQVLYAFFSYTEIIRREPGSLGARRWSLYGRLYLRHFNELNHELHERLGRGYKPTAKYMNSFTSPLLAVLAKNIAFFSGSVLAVLIALTVYDEDVLTVQHILTAITVLGIVITVTRWAEWKWISYYFISLTVHFVVCHYSSYSYNFKKLGLFACNSHNKLKFCTLNMIYLMHICLLITRILYLSCARSFIPDEHMVWCPEQLLQCMLAHIHYMPDHWRGNANKNETRDEVAQLFQYKAVRHGRFLKTGTHLSEIKLKILVIFMYIFFSFPPIRCSFWRSC